MNGKPCHILVNTRACKWDTGRSQWRVRILTRISSPQSLSVVPSQERKIKFHVVPPFPNPDRLVINPFLLGTAITIFLCLVFLRLSLRVLLNLGRGISCIPFWGDVSWIQRDIQYWQKYLLFIPAKDWKDLWHDSPQAPNIALWSQIGQIGNWYSEPDKQTFQAFYTTLKWNYVSRGKQQQQQTPSLC